MIDKITSSNGESYYKPAFDLINAALAEQSTKRDDPDSLTPVYDEQGMPVLDNQGQQVYRSKFEGIQINSIEDYFNNLDPIRDLWVSIQNDRQGKPVNGDIGGYLLLMPADEDIFEINANTREIAIPASVKKNGIGVFGDHFAEMIVLRIDRYFDNQDLLNTKCAINWNFTPSGARTPTSEEPKHAEAFVPNADIKPGYITFGFIINNEMTSGKGTLTFSVSFYDEAAGQISYKFNTLTASININDTLDLADPALIKSDVSNFLGRLTNSVYTDSTMPSIAMPVWHMGALDEEENFLGLPLTEYLPASTDASAEYIEGNGTMLQTFASTMPASANLYYRWVFSPVDGTVETARRTETLTRLRDYIKISSADMRDGYYYYLLDAMGRVEVAPVTFGEATSADAITVSNPLSYQDVQDILAAIEAINADENQPDVEIPDFYVLGSSFEALGAGNYQVFAQGHLGTGTYQEVLEGAVIKAGVNYYVKNDNDEIDVINPIRNDDAIQAQADGKTLYIFVGGSSNSPEAASNVCSVPAAIKPTVVLGVSSAYQFSDDVVEEEHQEGDTVYTYIDDTIMPDITATVSIDSEDNRDSAGQFAVQLIASDAAEITNESELEAVLNDLAFGALPQDGVFVSISDPAEVGAGKFLIDNMGEGSYAVRAFNRRNGTYSVSDNSAVINTSYVAPAITAIDVTTTVDGVQIPVLVNGERPNGQLVDLEMTRTRQKFDFVMADVSTNRPDATVAYYIEEVDYNLENDVITPRDPSGHDDQNIPYETYGQADLREIVGVEDDQGVIHFEFSIESDPGYYRIKTENHYHGTIHTAYTDIFGIESH